VPLIRSWRVAFPAHRARLGQYGKLSEIVNGEGSRDQRANTNDLWSGYLGKPDPSASRVSASAAPARSDIRAAASGTVSRSQAITYCSGMASGKNLLFDTRAGNSAHAARRVRPDDDAERHERRCFFPLPPGVLLTVSLAVVHGRGALRMAGSTCIALHT
jgi:hypothetical protein